MTTRINQEPFKNAIANLVPALGDIWAQFPHNRIILHLTNGKRYLTLSKSAFLEQGEVSFQVTVSRFLFNKVFNLFNM